MRKLASLALSLFLLTGTAFADSPKDTPKDSPKDAPKEGAVTAAKPAAANATTKTNAELAAQMEELRQALQAQQEQLQMLKEELSKRDRQIEEAREAAASANSRATVATVKATEAVNSTAEVRASNAALNAAVSNMGGSQEKKSDEPVAIHYKGITITPGGFVAAETVTRTRAESASINSDLKGIPYSGNALSKVSETDFTGRQSRLSLLAEGKVNTVKLTGYYEADFLGTGVTSNNRQSNSYVFRQRQVYAQAATDSGWIVTGGQMWSMATENKVGILNRQEWTPLTVDPQYTVGFTWARQYGFRVVKDFGGKFSLGIAVEGPQATVGGRGFSTVSTTTVGTASVVTTSNTFIDAPGDGAGLANFVDTAGNTVNKSPDFVFKATTDGKLGHYELFGIVSPFRNRVYPCGVVGTTTKDTVPGTAVLPCPVDGSTAPSALGAYNSTNVGGGLGASAHWTLLAKKVDFGVKAVGGDGVGRYGTAQLADLTFRPDGTASLIRTAHGLARLEWHPTPKLDIYAYYGLEYAWRAAYTGYDSITVTKTPAIPATATSPAIPATTVTKISTTGIGGYGSPFANNSGCNTEGIPGVTTLGGGTQTNQLTPGSGTCAGDPRIVSEFNVGFWHKLYQGPKGGLRWGLEYAYLYKNGWSGNNTAPTAAVQPAGVGPKAVNNMIWTSFRYYIP
jgi:FKBP-type peptidyl-prolyl cis-trans isomerase